MTDFDPVTDSATDTALDAASQRRAGLHARRLRKIGLAILVVGWLAAASVYFSAGPTEGGDVAGYASVGGQMIPIQRGESRSSTLQTERMGGKTGVWITGLNEWLGSLTRGKNLAFTLALVAAAVAGGCFYLASLADEEHES
jgi:hypothetical protein